MATPQDNISMALFCDFENVALGVRDAKYDRFDIKPVLERLLLKGSIVVKKAYCDWERYKGFKATMHEANFELIEIPHVRQSGKNSADIRLVVDALDLCYTKSHVNTFVIISGDSDFSPLVSKLRENAKYVIGVGVKQSTSDLLIANCDEFIFVDDLVRESQRAAAKREPREVQQSARRSPEEERSRKEEVAVRRGKAIDIAVGTFDAMVSERGDTGKIWASVLKEAIKRRNPGFNENYFGFRTFGNLLEEAQARGLLEFGRDEKSGAYVFRSTGAPTRAEPSPVMDEPVSRHDFHASTPVALEPDADEAGEQPASQRGRERGGRSSERGERAERGERRERGGRGRSAGRQSAEKITPSNAPAADLRAAPAPPPVAAPAPATTPQTSTAPEAKPARAPRARRGSSQRASSDSAPAEPAFAATPATATTPEAPAAKKAARPRSPRKPAAAKKAAE